MVPLGVWCVGELEEVPQVRRLSIEIPMKRSLKFILGIMVAAGLVGVIAIATSSICKSKTETYLSKLIEKIKNPQKRPGGIACEGFELLSDIGSLRNCKAHASQILLKRLLFVTLVRLHESNQPGELTNLSSLCWSELDAGILTAERFMPVLGVVLERIIYHLRNERDGDFEWGSWNCCASAWLQLIAAQHGRLRSHLDVITGQVVAQLLSYLLEEDRIDAWIVDIRITLDRWPELLCFLDRDSVLRSIKNVKSARQRKENGTWKDSFNEVLRTLNRSNKQVR